MSGSSDDGVPSEYTSESVRANSPREARLHQEFHTRREPATSMARLGLTFKPDLSSPTHLNFDDESNFYNVGEGTKAAAYWAGKDLPHLTRDIHQMRRDLEEWGYCLVKDALSPVQLARMQRRLFEQAEAERLAGIGLWLNASAKGANTQFVSGLVNKGQCFEDFLEHHPRALQAGPVVEQLMKEALGGEFLITSMLAIISHQHNFPQGLHQDQAMQFQDEVPMGINQMVMLADVGPSNGGTLVVPGSHKILTSAGSSQPVPFLPPPVNVTAPAGSILLWDTRLLHGAGVNRTAEPRPVIVAQALRPHLRTQENWALTVSPEVLARASDKLLFRLGFQANGTGTVEGHGLGASGRIGDEFSSILDFRRALDRGEYLRVGELSPEMPEEKLMAPFTYRVTASGRRSVVKAKQMGLLTPQRLAKAIALATGGRGEEDLAYTKRGNGNVELNNSASSKLPSKL